MNESKEVLSDDIFYVDKQIEDVQRWRLRCNITIPMRETMKPFANNVLTPEGGTHVVGFRTALNRTINDYARCNNLLKERVIT